MPVVRQLTFWQRCRHFCTEKGLGNNNRLPSPLLLRCPQMSCLSDFVVELLTCSLECVQCTWKNVAYVGRTVEEVLEEQPYTVIKQTDLHNLVSLVDSVCGLEKNASVILVHIADVWHDQLEELIVVAVVYKQEVCHLILEIDAAVVLIHFGAETLLAQEIQYHFSCCHSFSVLMVSNIKLIVVYKTYLWAVHVSSLGVLHVVTYVFIDVERVLTE